MEGSNDSLDYRKLKATMESLENLAYQINPGQGGSLDGKIDRGQWDFAIDLSKRVNLCESTSGHEFDGAWGRLSSLIHHLMGLIYDRIFKLEAVEDQDPTLATADRILEGKDDVGIEEAMIYLGKSRAHVYRLARANSITVIKNSRPQRFSSDSLRAYLRPAVKHARS
jgi:hypothetical protein